MSEYLWDKTGEPDEEVERLEALLGGFAHVPRPLAPTAHAAHAAPSAPDVRLRSWRFAPAGLAAAAALLLALLAGAAFLLRPAPGGAGAVASETLRPKGGALGKTSYAMLEPPPGIPPGVAKVERAALEIQKRGPREAKSEQTAPLQRRRQKSSAAAQVVKPDGGGGGLAFETMSAGGGGASSLFESTRLMTKEQLVYALRLTGAKLRDVRLRTQGRDGAEATPGVRAPTR